jgi:hypothetical protein
MRWKVKAAIQNTIAGLPSALSYPVYYRMQRLVGGLKRMNPVDPLSAGIETWRRILDHGRDPVGGVFFEVGTGNAPIVPLAYWLMGAERTITVDVNPYLKGELVREALDYMKTHEAEISDLFGPLLEKERMDRLMQFGESGAYSLERVLALCEIEYQEPADAARTGLSSGIIDFHTSCNVFEHIPPDVLRDILVEGHRIVSDDGLFVHMVDYSDHFSHSDATISPINFLQYSDEEWERFAGNRYMYMNRLRHDDVLSLFESAGHRIVSTMPLVDERSRRVLEKRAEHPEDALVLDRRFGAKTHDILSIRGSWIVSEKGTGGGDKSLRAIVTSARQA